MKVILLSLCFVALAAAAKDYKSSQAYNPYASYSKPNNYKNNYNGYDNNQYSGYSDNSYGGDYNAGYSAYSGGKSYDKNYNTYDGYEKNNYNGGYDKSYDKSYGNNAYNQYDNGKEYNGGYKQSNYDNKGYNQYDNKGYNQYDSGYGGNNYDSGYKQSSYNSPKSYSNDYNNDYQCPSLPSLNLMKPNSESNVVQYVGSGSVVGAYCGNRDDDAVNLIYVKCPNGKCVKLNERNAGLEESVNFYCQKTGKWAVQAGSYDFISVGGYSVICSSEGGDIPHNCGTTENDLAACLVEEDD